MPSLFPELFDFAMLGTFLIRATVGVLLFILGERILREVRRDTTASLPKRVFGYVYGSIQVSAGALLTVGLFTQAAALGGMFVSAVFVASGIWQDAKSSERHVYVLICAICTALLFLGPGAFAQDLPL